MIFRNPWQLFGFWARARGPGEGGGGGEPVMVNLKMTPLCILG
jgi:hypothetical protein